MDGIAKFLILAAGIAALLLIDNSWERRRVVSKRASRTGRARAYTEPVHLEDAINAYENSGPAHLPGFSLAAVSDLRNGKTLLMHWSAVGDESQVRTLLKHGADVDSVDDDGDTALYYALSNGNVRIVEMLLNHGANPNLTGRSGPVLLFAADQGWVDVIATLIDHGATLDLRNSDGHAAIMLAAGGGKDDAIRLLRKHRADVNAVDNDGDSVLYYAASRGRVSTVNLLLALGADPNPRPDASDETPLTVAAALSMSMHPLPPGTTGRDYTAIVLALLRAGASARLMYRKGFVLTRFTKGGMEIAPYEMAARLAFSDDWSVSYQVNRPDRV